MNGFTNENIIKLVFANYTLKENKTHLDNINSRKLYPLILSTLSFEYIFISKRTYRTLAKPDYGASELIALPDNNIIDISYNSMKLWDMHSYECKWKLTNGAISITRLPNGHLVTFAHSGEIQFWNNNFELIKVITLESCEGYRKKIFSLSNGNLACFAFKDGRDRIIIVDFQSNAVVKTLDLQLGIVNSIVNLSGNRFAACSDNGSINIWGMNDYKFLDCFTGEDNWDIRDLLFIEKGNLLITGTIISLGFWDVAYSPPQLVHRITDVYANCLLLLPNGYFASGGRNGNVKIWSYTTFQCINELSGSGYLTHSILLLKDYTIVSSSNREISIWDY
jgi:WD40 repeat protein